jgi:hypothetical protein
MKTIGIIGSRRRTSNKDFVQLEAKFLEIYKDGDELVSGGCASGGDAWCEILAKKYQVPIKIYYAQWDKLGKGAGFARNTYIARDADILLCVVAGDRTGGTEDTIKKATKMGKKIILLLPDNFDRIEKIEIKEDIFSV